LLKKYYNEHKNTFIEPVKVKVKYIEFDPSTVTVPDNITDAELQSYYLKNKDKFKQDEQIKARHILIRVANFNDNKSLQDALAKAESVYKQAITGKKSLKSLQRSTPMIFQNKMVVILVM